MGSALKTAKRWVLVKNGKLHSESLYRTRQECINANTERGDREWWSRCYLNGYRVVMVEVKAV